MRGRVLGVLAVARSFGDYALKKFVPCEPFIGKRKITSMVRNRGNELRPHLQRHWHNHQHKAP